MEKNTLLVKVIDLVDMPFSYVPDLYDRLSTSKEKHPLLLVGNKVDLFPGHGSATINSLEVYLKEISKNLSPIDVLFVSGKTGFGVSRLRDYILRYAAKHNSNILLVGRTNVGKSMLYNALIGQSQNQASLSTVSRVHGTTAGFLRKRLFTFYSGAKSAPSLNLTSHLRLKNLWFSDSPGYFMHHQRFPQEMEHAIIKHKIRPQRHVLKLKETGLLGDFLQISIIPSEICELKDFRLEMQFFTRNDLVYRRMETNRVDDIPLAGTRTFQFDIAAGSPSAVSIVGDLVISGGIGWLAIKQPPIPVAITVKSKPGIDVQFRAPLRSRFL